MPEWDDLSKWLQLQITVIAFFNWELETFSIHLHPKLEAAWVSEGRDLRKEIRDNMRREFNRLLGRRAEYYFVIEGWSKWTKSQTVIHIHGGAVILEDGDAEDSYGC